ncbi:MAG: phosphoglycerate kinase, partial [Candidatus Eremiobacteraeota bacterium]|nr:phosphoglycerate kinase [Candidatus Eremiobacteraeota bacterium]
LPSYAGLLMEAELAALTRLTEHPAHPFVCAIGGAKVADKVGVFENLLDKVDAFVIGGGMANTFLAAQGINVGRSLRDLDLEPAKRILALAAAKNVTLHLPTDAVVADSFDADGTAHTVPIMQVGDGMILDIGPATAVAYAAVLRAAKTIVFNGPMGVYEKAAYQNGTRVIGEAIAAATKAGATSVVGGGDAAAAAHALGFADAMTHVSTGGGATLEFLEGKTLPGVAALEHGE